MTKWNTQCRFFDEKYACDTLSSENYKTCEECKFSSPYSKKILIIKLGAIGDVLRTTPILSALKKKYGEEILIYWMTNLESVDLFKNNPLVDKILEYNPENVLRIQQEEFDILFSLEIDTPTTLLANLIKAKEKFGFYFNNGATSYFNNGAESYLETAFLQHVKLQNRKSYQQLIFEVCNLSYNKEKLIFYLSEKDIKFGKKFMEDNRLSENDKIIGINIGSGSRWSSKFFSDSKIKELIKKLSNKYKIILLGGPNEIDKQKRLIKEFQKQGISLFANNPNNTLNEFASVVKICDLIICGDTMILHLASSLNKPTIALFFVTPPWEIEDYENITKLTSPILKKHFFINQIIPELEESISIDSVLKKIEEKTYQNK